VLHVFEHQVDPLDPVLELNGLPCERELGSVVYGRGAQLAEAKTTPNSTAQ
jgi:hypothetical protein